MKVPISWLRDYVEIDISVEELAERLTLAGLEVGEIRYIGIPQGDPPPGINLPPSDHLVWDREKLVLGYIREVKPHPDADRLTLALVDYGGAELEQCVTGAPNLHPYKGQGPLDPPLLSPFAHEGAEVYDGHAEDGSRMILQGKELRGIYNKSMVCSEKELGISDEHEGILLLDHAEFKHLAPGTPLQDVLGDAVLDIDMLPNIARAYSVLGVAREVAALLGKELQYPSYDVLAEGPAIQGQAALDIREPELNPRFTLALIRDVDIRPSPGWMQRRLRLVGQRPINNIVDVTNYVMFEIGQPLHAYDYDALLKRSGGQPPTLITRLPHEGEHLVTLDAQDHALEAHNILVADDEGGLGFGGIMGGLDTEIWDPETMSIPPGQDAHFAGRPATRTVLLEAAAWNFINIRRTMAGQKMATEAGLRFSRGVHPEMAPRGVRRGIELMRQTGGGVIASGIIDDYPLPEPVVTVDLSLAYVARLLGFTIPREDVIRILRALEFSVEDLGADTLRVTVPDHRLDIGSGITGQADLGEEIARVYGYDRVPNTLIEDALPAQRNNPGLLHEEMTRDALARAGLREIVTYRLTTPEREKLLTPAGQPNHWPQVPYVTLANPIAADKTVMRHTLLAGLLDVAAANARHTERQLLFEVGSVYLPVEGQLLPDEPARLGLLLTGPRGVPQWTGDVTPGVMDFFDLKGVVEALLRELRVAGLVTFTPSEHSTFHPGRVAALTIGGRAVGVLGQVHPLVCEAFGLGLNLEKPVLAAEFDLAALTADLTQIREIAPVPTQPAVYQDMALVVDTAVSADAVLSAILGAGGDLLEDARLFDVYTGDPIPAGKKSLAYALTYRAPDRTLKDKEVARVHSQIAKAVKQALGAELRA